MGTVRPRISKFFVAEAQSAYLFKSTWATRPAYYFIIPYLNLSKILTKRFILLQHKKLALNPSPFYIILSSLLIKRFNSTKNDVIRSTELEVPKLNPMFISGFTDGEGCYHVAISPAKGPTEKQADQFNQDFPPTLFANVLGGFSFFSLAHTSTRWTRNYSMISTSRLGSVDNLNLNPWWVTGFVDGEGCFTVSVIEYKKYKIGWTVKPSFKIGLHAKDKAVLEGIKNFLRVGKIYQRGLKGFHSKSNQLKNSK